MNINPNDRFSIKTPAHKNGKTIYRVRKVDEWGIDAWDEKEDQYDEDLRVLVCVGLTPLNHFIEQGEFIRRSA